MAVTVPESLTAEEQAALLAQAKVLGVSVDLRGLSVEELDNAFEQAADLIPAATPSLSDEALSRESIYTREDEWNTHS